LLFRLRLPQSIPDRRSPRQFRFPGNGGAAQTRNVARAGSFVLGAPLLTDVFHADRWDYVYRFQPGKGKLQERKLTVIFENGSLARLEGDVRPDEAGTQ
jgi:hypothetical protein